MMIPVSPEQPVPVIIYRVTPEEAFRLGILARTVEVISQLAPYHSFAQRRESPQELCTGDLPSLRYKPIAALSNGEGLERSRRERKLWLLQPQLLELQPYRGGPPLLALEQGHGFYEAYLPSESSALCCEWYGEEQLQDVQQQLEALPESRFWSGKSAALPGLLLRYFFRWQEQGHSLLSGKTHARLPQKRPELERYLEQNPPPIPDASEIPLQPRFPKTAGGGGKGIRRVRGNQRDPESLQGDRGDRGNKEEQFPPQLWLDDAARAIGHLRRPRLSSKEQQQSLARGLWALLAFWASARLRPESVLGKLAFWLRSEQQRQGLRGHPPCQKQAPCSAQSEATSLKLDAWRAQVQDR